MNPQENLNPNYVIYQQLLNGCFEKIRKTLPKKFKELRDLCGEAMEQVKADEKDAVLSGNKYFRIMKLALDAKIPRLTEQLLYYIQKLVAHGLMDGNHPDDCLYPEDARPESNGMLPRRLIDAIVDEVCACTTERDQQVQLQVVRALLTIVATSTTEVHERSLLKVVSSLYYIHIACANQVNQNTAKASLIQMISIVFKKLEQHSGEFSESLRRLGAGDASSTTGESTRGRGTGAMTSTGGGDASSVGEVSRQGDQGGKPGDDSSRGPSSSNQRDGRSGRNQEESKRDDAQSASGGPDQTMVTFTPEEQYAQVTMNLMIDNVCMHSAKVGSIKKTQSARSKALKEAGGDAAAAHAQLKEQAAREEQAVPLSAVSRWLKSTKSKSKQEPKEEETGAALLEPEEALASLVNEVGALCGKFGWCVACRATANLYCKHTRHPVCSYECKQRHIRLLEEASATAERRAMANPEPAAQPQSMDEPCQRDALLVFNKLCQLLQSKDLDRKLENVYDVRKVLLGLDLIHSCLENPGSTFINRSEFVSAIRDSLCGALLKFAASSEHKIFSRTVSIFYCLFLHFREHLKKTIGVFIDGFFLRILDSGNSEYDYKYSILEFFDRLSENAEHVLEIFANYDCDIGQKDVCGRMIDSLASIAQGRFQRGEHSSGVMSAQQEASLRRQALEVLVKILRNLNRTIEAAAKLETMTQARLAENRQERVIKQAQSAFESRQEEDGSSSRGEQSLLTVTEHEEGEAGTNERPATGQRRADQLGESPDARQQVRNRLFKQEMKKAADKFNIKPKNGLKYLMEHGHIPSEAGEEQATAIAKFLRNTPSLSPTAVGAYLGGEAEFNGHVRTAYVNLLDFASKETSFVGCQRLLLSGFRIPGEGQQADRIMEAFGEKLARDRPEEFGAAEGVYVLAYATLMLQTALHNPSAQKLRMTLDDFRKITRGVKLSENGRPDMDEFLADVYEEVAREPFTLEEDEDARLKAEGAAGANKKLLFDKEREGILRRGATILKQDQKHDRFVLIKDISTIEPMFSSTWSAHLAVFSAVLADSEAEESIVADICLQGFVHAIRIAGFFAMADPRSAFVSSLAQFTAVAAGKEIKAKNVACIRELLNLALHTGDRLRDSWRPVLECISKIDHLRVLGLGDLTDSQYFQSQVDPTESPQSMSRQIMQRNASIVADQIDGNQIDAIFLQSEKLNTDGIVDFIENLCRVSRDELADQDNPKKFCLQKLVEVASLNMNRVRFQWQSIWRNLAEHFTWVGSHKNLHVVIYALDSLRQLADKFLEKEERKNFNYQKMFLQPFEIIMQNNLTQGHREIKEYVVMCMAALCHQKAKYLKSGWDPILRIFSLAAQDQESHLGIQSFQSLEYAITNFFHILEESFLELVDCLGAFARSSDIELRGKALSLVVTCAKELSSREVMFQSFIADHGAEFLARDQDNYNQNPPMYGIKSHFLSSVTQNVPGSSKEDDQMLSSDSLTVELSTLKALWFPPLRIFLDLILQAPEPTRQHAAQCLERTLLEHQDHFTYQLWREIFCSLLLPALEAAENQVKTAQTREQITHSTQTLKMLLESFNRLFSDPTHKSNMLSLVTAYSDILCLFASRLSNQELSLIVMMQLKFLVAGISQQTTSPQLWNDMIEQISYLYQLTKPSLLMDEMQNFQTQQLQDIMTVNQQARIRNQQTGRNTEFEQSNAHCATQLQLTIVVAEIIKNNFDMLQIEQISVLLEALDSQYKFSKEFNSELTLRLRLRKSGYSNDEDHLPGLFALEEESLKVYLSILFQQLFKKGSSSKQNQSLFDLCSKVLKDYALKHSELVSINSNTQAVTKQSAPRDAQSMNESEISKLHKQELEKQLDHLGPIIHQVILENMLQMSEKELHSNIQDLGQLLIDLTLCNDYQVRFKNHKLLTSLLTKNVIKL